jgi:hypothetical protein
MMHACMHAGGRRCVRLTQRGLTSGSWQRANLAFSRRVRDVVESVSRRASLICAVTDARADGRRSLLAIIHRDNCELTDRTTL